MKTKNNWYACYVKSLFLILLWLVLLPPKSFAQQGTITGTGTVFFAGSLVKVSGQKTFTSYINKDNVADMVQLDAIRLFNMNADLGGHIIPGHSGGEIEFTIFAFDSTLPASGYKGAILYKLIYKDDQVNPSLIPSPFNPTVSIKSTDMKLLLYGAKTNLAKQGTISTNLSKTTLAYIKQQVLVGYDKENPLVDLLRGNNYLLTQPVIVEVKMKDAALSNYNGLKAPGLVQQFDLANYFDLENTGGLKVEVFVNNRSKHTYSSKTPDAVIIDATMGDEIRFEVSPKYPTNNTPPIIEGIPDVWIARFAGDLMYYCSPSITPAEYKPWIGFDSKVHTLQMRRYPSNSYKTKIRNWDIGLGSTSWTWEITASRKMDANIVKQDSLNIWRKWQGANGVDDKKGIQRNDQREGLNIQFLNYWQGGLRSFFDNYATNNSKYFMGFDSDALLYLNTNKYNTKLNPPPFYPNGGVLKLDVLPWRYMPEGKDQIVDVTTGYPAQGFTPGIMVQAYQANREALDGNTKYNTFKRYNGYEIQDKGTDYVHPDGTGTGNKAAPGAVTVRKDNMVVRFKMNVKAPFNDSKGFYGSITGETWPAYFEKNIPYTLSGLEGLSDLELDKFVLEYSGTNTNGDIAGIQTKRLSDLTTPEKQSIKNTGKWTVLFNNEAPVYSCITAYYQRVQNSERAMIAGKELKSLYLLFFGDKNLGEAKGGLGANTWWNDYRTKEDAAQGYIVQKNMGGATNYIKPIVKSYVYKKGSTTIFTAWDGDPHMFMETPEFYLSSRTKAKRITDNYLDGKKDSLVAPYLQFYINGVLQPKTLQNGKDITIRWDNVGDFELTVKYRNTEGNLTSLTNHIKIVDYEDPIKGLIARRPLTVNEGTYLGITNHTSWDVLEVNDVLSRTKYIESARANGTPPGLNRWADFNDFKATYLWRNSDNAELKQPTEFQSKINTYLTTPPTWFWNNWCLHYSSNWQDGDAEKVPPYVNNNTVLRITSNQLDLYNTYLSNHLFTPTPPAAWQRVMPLVSITDFQGYRMRYNPSCIYDLSATWNNMTGAFSGTAYYGTASDSLAPDISDTDKNRQEFYYKLKGKEILIIPKATSPDARFTVDLVDYIDTHPKP